MHIREESDGVYLEFTLASWRPFTACADPAGCLQFVVEDGSGRDSHPIFESNGPPAPVRAARRVEGRALLFPRGQLATLEVQPGLEVPVLRPGRISMVGPPPPGRYRVTARYGTVAAASELCGASGGPLDIIDVPVLSAYMVVGADGSLERVEYDRR